MRTVLFVAAVSFLVAPMVASAQQSPPADSVPHAGEWAAEAAVTPSATGASLLRFRSRTFAWVLGADFNTARSKSEFSGPVVGDVENTSSFTAVTARLGVRSYRQSGTERLRPVLGAGAVGNFSRASGDARLWRAGVYGELGAMYFVASHLSLGATGELQASYVKQTQGNANGAKTKATTTSVGGSLVRLLVSVYF